MDSATFRRTCSRFATGVAIATVIAEDGSPHGMTVNSLTSVSVDPPMVLICVDYSSNLLAMFRASLRYGLSILDEDQQELSHRFAQRGQDRFDGIPWEPGATGVPLIPGALAQLECEIRTVVESGDHAVLIAQVVAARESAGGRPLLYFDSAYRSIR